MQSILNPGGKKRTNRLIQEKTRELDLLSVFEAFAPSLFFYFGKVNTIKKLTSHLTKLMEKLISKMPRFRRINVDCTRSHFGAPKGSKQRLFESFSLSRRDLHVKLAIT